MIRNLILYTTALFIFTSCGEDPNSLKSLEGDSIEIVDKYSEYFKKPDTKIQTGGIEMIPIETPSGIFNVWTKRVGNNPDIKVLLLNGGPGGNHAYFECLENYFPEQQIEFIYYDQLACGFSDNPEDTSLYSVERYVDELEQVRKALHLDNSNFFLLGHSWGGILAMEYGIRYQENLKGLIISNMMASCPEYDKYAEEVLGPQLDPEVLNEIKEIEANNDFSNPRYMELLEEHFYPKHVTRLNETPDPIVRGYGNMNPELYVLVQGPSEFGIGGKLTNWDVSEQLKDVNVPTLCVGATHDTMDPEYMKWMSTEFPQGEFLLCPNGSHCCMYDDQEVYMAGLINFLNKNK